MQTTNDRSSWINKGRAGQYNVWHVGKSQYVVTKGVHGSVIGSRDSYGRAFTLAKDEYEYEEFLADQEHAHESKVQAGYAARGQANLY